MSTVTVTGNVVAPPELKYTPAGQAVASFRMAENRKVKDEEKSSFYTVTCWADLAENVAECIDKGIRVIVTGRLEQRQWETKEGEKRSVVEIVADEVGASVRWATVEVHRAERRTAE